MLTNEREWEMKELEGEMANNQRKFHHSSQASMQAALTLTSAANS